MCGLFGVIEISEELNFPSPSKVERCKAEEYLSFGCLRIEVFGVWLT
jgi:hypothetical protein